MKKIGIIVNCERDPDLAYTQKTIQYLTNSGFQVYFQQSFSNLTDVSILQGDTFFTSIDALVTLGGDGTVLLVAQKAALYNKPIVGINLGHIGYLAQLERDDLEQLPSIFSGATDIEHRFMLRLKVIDFDGNEQTYYALNDVVLSRQIACNMLHADLYSNDEFVFGFRCDGLIFATPTGSTAYSMSSGGPIADCNLNEIIIFTPVCEHSFFSKSMIFSASDELSCRIRKHADNTFLILDGKKITSMQNVKKIQIDKSPYTLPLFQPDGERFYKVLNKKFSAGGNI